MKVRKSNRRELREKVLQVLYAYEFNGEGLTSLTEGILTDVTLEVDRNFAKQLINHVVANQKMLNEIIRERLANWEMDRVALIDRILLKIGIAEIFFFQEIPPKVSINEVIEIAKDYSTSNSGKFINGILDTVLSELKDSGSLNKTGRGLVEETIAKNPPKK